MPVVYTPEERKAAKKVARYKSLSKKHLASPEVPCSCGCGLIIHSISLSGMPQSFVSGHNARRYFGEQAGEEAKAARRRARDAERYVPTFGKAGSARKEITFEVNERGCHICTSHAPNTHGYPQLWANGTNHNMHRVLFIEAFGELPSGIMVRHDCDDRLCINLAHLQPGTAAQNSDDQRKRGRFNPRRGEDSSGSKLTSAQAREIILSTDTHQSIGDLFGITQGHVSRIKAGLRWSHFQGITQ